MPSNTDNLAFATSKNVLQIDSTENGANEWVFYVYLNFPKKSLPKLKIVTGYIDFCEIYIIWSISTFLIGININFPQKIWNNIDPGRSFFCHLNSGWKLKKTEFQNKYFQDGRTDGQTYFEYVCNTNFKVEHCEKCLLVLKQYMVRWNSSMDEDFEDITFFEIYCLYFIRIRLMQK